MSRTTAAPTADPDPLRRRLIHSVTHDFATRSTVVRLRGELDAYAASALAPSLLSLAAEGDRALVLDLSAVSFCDSSGADLFLQVHRRLSAGTRLLLRGIVRQPARVLRMLGLHHALPCDFTTP